MKLRKLFAALTALALTGCASTQGNIPNRVTTDSSPTATSTEPLPGTIDTDDTPPTADTVEPELPVTVETEEQPDYAETLLAGMSTEEKAGQVVLARYPGFGTAQEVIAEFHPGGFTLFGADFRDSDPETLTQELAQLQEQSGIPLLLAVDEEGGTVVRASKYPQFRDEEFPAQSEVLASGGAQGVYSDAAEKSAFLRALGLNMNLAPVCDLPRSLSDYIADRAFGTDVDEVTEAVRNAVAGYCDNSFICTLKHFPGYGNNLDTHTGISLDSRPMSELQELDLRPFTAGMEQGAPVVMVSHNIVECVNADLPGSLSPEMYALVRSLGFDGVIMTDDLSMQAVGEYCGENKAAVTAFLAGADLLCSSDYENAVSALAAAVNSGEISQERLDQSVLRILRMKIKYGVIPTEVG